MEILRRNRKALRAQITRYEHEIGKILVADPLDKEAVQVKWDTMQKRFGELVEVDSKVYQLLLEEEDEQLLVNEMEEVDVYLEKFSSTKIKCQRLLFGDQASIPAINSMVTTSREEDVQDWLAFWAQFKKVHDDVDIDVHDKIEYLVQASVPESRARQLVESYPAMRENYSKIIDGLKTRFGREDLQIEVYVHELLKLVLANATSRSQLELSVLYDRIETQLRALDTLGITSDKCAAILFPLIESCLPEELLRAWQRAANVASVSPQAQTISVITLEVRLQNLMHFLKGEVENEQRISLATEGFGFHTEKGPNVEDKRSNKLNNLKAKASSTVATAAGLFNSNCQKCLFCAGSHDSEVCFKAQKWKLDQKMKLLTEKRACFRCLRAGHVSKRCNARLRCLICEKPHVVLMCPELPTHKKSVEVQKEPNSVAPTDQVLSNYSSPQVFLQTIIIGLRMGGNVRKIGALIDTGSQRSYLLQSTARLLGYSPKGQETLIHGLFGGVQMEMLHNCYDITLSKYDKSFSMEVLDQKVICHNVPSRVNGPWWEELKALGISIDDDYRSEAIELLIGADFAGFFYTGSKHILPCGLVAMETIFGWTLMGRVERIYSDAMLSLSCLSNDLSITGLWQLDVLGIKDPLDERDREAAARAAKQFFKETVVMDSEGRYKVKLLWLADHAPLPSNYILAKRRLEGTLKKLKDKGLYEAYNNVFREWLSEGIIEKVKDESGKAHYLPHRPVIKEHSTTKICPVFDASASGKGEPSLNNCLEKGENLIELFPDILLGFREFEIGIVADIKKAFLQISIDEDDRDFLRFLWIETDGSEIIYRHKRVVFGVTCSPFLLGATLDYHLAKSLVQCTEGVGYSAETVERLKGSFYVDNCVTIVETYKTRDLFIREAQVVMSKGRFELRGWEFSGNPLAIEASVSVLGLNWNISGDFLAPNSEALSEANKKVDVVTKRVILSKAQCIFDPIGFTCPATLKPKLLLQSLWEKRLTWDQAVDKETEDVFRKWLNELPSLCDIQIPRWLGFKQSIPQSCSLHTFCDASKEAYAAVIFLRIVKDDQVIVKLVSAKSRVTPLKGSSIPRLELLAATVGTRLYRNVIRRLNFEGLDCFFWCDSSTVLSWVKRKEQWSVFVFNRVEEIRKFTDVSMWRYVPGSDNPADLPSRGCGPRQLFES